MGNIAVLEPIHHLVDDIAERRREANSARDRIDRASKDMEEEAEALLEELPLDLSDPGSSLNTGMWNKTDRGFAVNAGKLTIDVSRKEVQILGPDLHSPPGRQKQEVEATLRSTMAGDIFRELLETHAVKAWPKEGSGELGTEAWLSIGSENNNEDCTKWLGHPSAAAMIDDAGEYADEKQTAVEIQPSCLDYGRFWFQGTIMVFPRRVHSTEPEASKRLSHAHLEEAASRMPQEGEVELKFVSSLEEDDTARSALYFKGEAIPETERSGEPGLWEVLEDAEVLGKEIHRAVKVDFGDTGICGTLENRDVRVKGIVTIFPPETVREWWASHQPGFGDLE